MEGRYLGQVIAMCCSVLDPEKVILGGGVALAFDQYKEPLIRTVKQELNIGGKTIPADPPHGAGRRRRPVGSGRGSGFGIKSFWVTVRAAGHWRIEPL